MLDLVTVKIRFGKSKIPLTMLVHDSAAMGYFHSPGLFELAQMLEHKGFDLADRNITNDALTGIEILIGVDNFTRLIIRQKRSMGTSLFVTRGGGGYHLVHCQGGLPQRLNSQVIRGARA